jgi:hypothetical protein
MFYLVQYKRNALYDVLESNEENSFTQNEDWAYTPTEAILSYSVENGLNELSEPISTTSGLPIIPVGRIVSISLLFSPI